MPEHTISENLARLQQAKSDIANAITTMGGTVNSGDGFEEFPADIATIPSGGDSHFRSNLFVTTEPGAVVTATRVSIQLNVKAESGAPITITDGFTTLTGTGTGDWQVFWLPNTETWTVSDGTATEVINVSDTTPQSVNLVRAIYGAVWYISSSTRLTRTDDSSSFSDPVPYVSGASTYGSPFDDLYPWSEMTVETIDGNSLIKIPKFYYKITKTSGSMKFQIADYAAEGFLVSPAHQDRGDGIGERDYVYVGRYHCSGDSGSLYKSISGVTPQASKTRATFRTQIHNLGSNFWQFDYATLVTIWLLYIVEFADWNSQAKIGYGCGNNSSKQNTGASDSMPYHTGTMQSSRTTYGVGTQYRGIEDLWGNVHDWCDGIRFSGSSIYVYKNPSEFSDSSGGINTGTRPLSSGYISNWNVPSTSGYEWALYPSAVEGSISTYVPDACNYHSSGVVLHVGGYYIQGSGDGLFYLGGNYSDSKTYSEIGSRLMYLPPNS